MCSTCCTTTHGVYNQYGSFGPQVWSAVYGTNCLSKKKIVSIFHSFHIFLILVLFLTFFDGGFGPRLDFFLIFTYFVFIFINLNVLLW